MVGGNEIDDVAQVLRDGASQRLGALIRLGARLRRGERLTNVRAEGGSDGVINTRDRYSGRLEFREFAALTHSRDRAQDEVRNGFTIHVLEPCASYLSHRNNRGDTVTRLWRGAPPFA